MSLRTRPVPVIFAANILWMAAVVGSCLGTSGVRNPVFYAIGVIGVIAFAALLTVVVAGQRRRVRLKTLSEKERYRLAIQTGEVLGDVGRWPARIRRDLKLTIATMTLFVFAPAMLGVSMLLSSVLGAAVNPWSMVPLVVISGAVVWQQWRIRQRLWILAGELCALDATAQNLRT